MRETAQELAEKLRETQRLLAEAEETLDAIRAGAVDAFVIDRGAGARVYTLEAADRRYRLLVESMQQGAAVLLADGTVLFANDRLAQLFGAELAALRGRSILQWLTPNVQDTVLRAILAGRIDAVHREILLEFTTGAQVMVEWASSPIPDDDSHAIGVILTDLSERRRHEAVLVASEQLRQIDQRKNEFLATLAHELRNPLAPITNAIELLRSTAPSTPSSQRAVSIIDRQTKLLARLVDDLLDLGRISTGHVALDRAPVRLVDVLQRAVETSQPLMARGGHIVRTQFPTEPIWVDGDEYRLGQVFSNLLNNAAVYSALPSTVHLTVEANDERVLVSVRDQGIGIDPSMLGVVFDLFAQANPGRHGVGTGLGIGLSLVKSLVESHGGRVAAHSDGLGRGARFDVELPRGTAPPVDSSAAAQQRADAESRRMHVLVVDDNEDAATSLRDVLDACGMHISVAHDGQSALQMVEAQHPDVVLLDLGMPGIDGYETCRRLRQRRDLAPMRIVALTGWGMEQDRRRTAEAGFDLHLVKPVAPQRIMEHLNRWQATT